MLPGLAIPRTVVLFLPIGGSLIAWKTKKQVAVSHSSADAELRAVALVTVEVTWLRWLLEDFSVSVTIPTPFFLTVHGLLVLLVIR
jgi:hypothetical protein